MTMLDLARTAAALTLGAAAMYYLDPDKGRRRRALARDQALSAGRRVSDVTRTAGRRAWNRSRGLAAQGRARIAAETPSDAQLHDRIRSRIGRVVTHPRAIHVQVTDAGARLDGDVLSDELDGLLCAVGATPGVREVDNRLRVHDAPGGVSALQGAGRRIGDEARHVSALSAIALAAAPVAILVGVAGRSVRQRANGVAHDD
ncbi:MAG: BON domain-containing protein [Burkholderiaceae bacterium]|nr:BON domain-containing protein [Burkholderiaceae bacterium]